MPRIFDLISLVLQLRDQPRLKRVLDTYSVDDDHHRKVQDYNAGVLLTKKITTSRRVDEYYQILAMPPRDLSSEKLLSIGPRNVVELLTAWLHGFSWKNIEGIDLFSTNPKITVMNMEDMSFPDNSFDAIAMSNALVYAKDAFAAISEVARVLRSGGRFAFGHSYHPEGASTYPEEARTGKEIYEFMRKQNLEIYYYRVDDQTNSMGNLQTTHTFGVYKPLPGQSHRDPRVL